MTLSHPVVSSEQTSDNRVCTSILGDELLRPRIHRFLGGPRSADRRAFSSVDRAFYVREEWSSPV